MAINRAIRGRPANTQGPIGSTSALECRQSTARMGCSLSRPPTRGKAWEMSLRSNRSVLKTLSSSLNEFDIGVIGWERLLSQEPLLFLFGCLLDLALYTHSSPALWQRMHRVSDDLSPTHRSFCWWHLSHDLRNGRLSVCLTAQRSVQSKSKRCSAAVSIALSPWSSEIPSYGSWCMSGQKRNKQH
jgi:hypothetical protein